MAAVGRVVSSKVNKNVIQNINSKFVMYLSIHYTSTVFICYPPQFLTVGAIWCL